ncbi:putative ribonuclease H-like domain-containing protein [Tanacetum coccineum]|uniref:Ribonuclease H-like domain-containing protein n=1 Tax=Tanacetum coccineum TaxID=301880 RepID=A0ABQ5ADZ5_9ASTR
MVPRTVLTTPGPISVNVARPVNTVESKIAVNHAGPMKNIINMHKQNQLYKGPFNKITTANNSNFNKRVNDKNVNAARPNVVVTTARPKAVLSAVKGNTGNAVKASACWVWRPKHKVLDHVSRNNGASMSFKRFDYGNPQQDLKDKEVIDSGCSRHMTGNRSYLTDYEEIDGGFVSFGGNSKGGKLLGKVKLEWRHSMDSPDTGFKPSGEEEKKDAEDPGNKDSEVPSTEEPRVNQEKDASVNSTNTINTVSPTVNTAGIEDNVVDENIVYGCDDDLNMPKLEEIIYSDDDEDVGAEADINNLDTHIPVSPIPTIKIHMHYPVEQIIKDIYSASQTRRMTKSVTQHVMFTLKDPELDRSLMQEELLQFKLQQVWTLIDLPNGKRAIGTQWVYGNKKDERDFVVYQMEVKSAFLYGKIEEEVYVCQPPRFEDPNFPDKYYKVEKALYGLHQAPRAWYETLSTYLLDNGFQRGKIDKTLFIRRDKCDILLVQVYVDDIIFGSTKKALCTEFEKMMHKKF